MVSFSLGRKVFLGCVGLVSLPFFPCLLFHFLVSLKIQLPSPGNFPSPDSTSSYIPAEIHCLMFCCSVLSETFPSSSWARALLRICLPS